MPYSAFISYSHAADDNLAAALQRGLHQFARPWYRVGASAATLMPLVEAIRAHAFAAERIHADETTVPWPVMLG